MYWIRAFTPGRAAARLLVVSAISIVLNSLWGDEVQSGWRPLRVIEETGLLAQRQNLWREGRLWNMLHAENGYLLAGFENRPGIHPWQGEHVGKWLHAAVLAQRQTGDARLLEAIRETVRRLVATQMPDGYLGTYGPDYTFMAMPENRSLNDVADDVVDPARKKVRPSGGWDTWTLRYNLYGLLTHDAWHPDASVVEACRKMADLLIEYYGPGRYDLTKYGTRQGISATTLLESIVMLYERTQDSRYLEFAEHIVEMSENNPKLRLMGKMLQDGSVVESGDGKAYQLMANLLGYLRLYQATGNPSYLETVLTGWRKIRADHTFVTGGPWSMKKEYNGNSECFAYPGDFDPLVAHVETCSTTTWIQLNLHLQELTGEAKYAAEAERAVFNALLAAQFEEGMDWCYFTKCNDNNQPYEGKITCCASSGPRALEMISQYVVGECDGGISLASLVPSSIELPGQYGGAKIRVSGNYPVDPCARITIDKAEGREFALSFREPSGATLEHVLLNGKQVEAIRNRKGYHEIRHPWKTGDVVEVMFDYKAGAEILSAGDGRSWVAYSYGPWALSRKWSQDDKTMEPLLGKRMDEEFLQSQLQIIHSGSRGMPHFHIRNSSVELEPYYLTGSRATGPQTYFILRDL